MAELYSLGSLYNDANLNAYWRLNGNSNEEKHSLSGTDTAITYSIANGKYGQGAGFNGTTSKITLPVDNYLKPSVFTILAWIKPTSAGLGTVFSTYNSERGFALQLTAAGSYRVYFTSSFVATSSVDVVDGAWHLVGATYNGSACQLYHNGVADGSPTSGTMTTYVASPTNRIGSLNSGSETQFFPGAIDDVILFSRVLTGGEIFTIYKDTGGNPMFFNGSLALG